MPPAPGPPAAPRRPTDLRRPLPARPVASYAGLSPDDLEEGGWRSDGRRKDERRRARGDGSEDGGVTGTGAGGDVAGKAVPGQEAEHGEGIGLLGGRGEAEVVDRAEAGGGDALGEEP